MSSSKPELPSLSSTTSRSSISAIPMSELEPSPVDEDDNPFENDEKTLPKPATYSSSSSSSSSTSFLGISHNRLLHTLGAIQKYSVIPPSIYLTMHYTNTAIIPLFTRSLEKSDSYLLLTRPYYQSFPLEPLLIFAPVLAHIISGVALRIIRRRVIAKRHGAETYRERRKIPWPKVSTTSALGFMLYPMFVAHVLVNRVTPKKVDGGSSSVGLKYFAYGVSRHSVLLNLGYAAMLCVASWHFVTGASKFLKLAPEYIVGAGEDGRKSRRRRGWLINGIAAIMAGVWIGGGLGVVARAGSSIQQNWETKHWDQIYKAVPLIGSWL